jgi:alpha-ketoglutarate-dependent sulfate ester dioxygenase
VSGLSRSSAASSRDYETILVAKVGAHIGAVISGVRIGEVDKRQAAEIRRALTDHKVVFFRGQDNVDDNLHREFARLGTVTRPHPTIGADGDVILPIDSERGKANSWHTDLTFIDRVPAGSILRAINLPPYGGTTVWANTTRAYKELHPSLRVMADSLWAVHTNLYDYAAERDEKLAGGVNSQEKSYRDEFGQTEYVTEHPVVHIHPLSKERSLLLGHFVKHFVGMGGHDSNDLFQLLQRRITRLDNTVRWNWASGDVAMWDNHATQHYAVDDYDDQPRLLNRITLAGSIPLGIDGRRSRAVKGDASSFSTAA